MSHGPDRMAEWSRRETSEPGVLGSNPAQVNDCQLWKAGLLCKNSGIDSRV